MPIFEYRCAECQNEFEELVLSGDDSPACPKCGSDKTEKLMSACSSKVDGGGPDFSTLQDAGPGCSGGG